MASIFERLFNVARAYANRSGNRFSTQDDARNTADSCFSDDEFHDSSDHTGPGRSGARTTSGVSGQVVEDLAVFGLTPPSTLDEVRAALRREMKKYHPDKFMQDGDKTDTANKVAQIYNAAYDRLKRYYSQT
ncbi:MAG: DnaJ domain-containing protein [Chitinivibrionales bacterium]|nr:DnaJ domain-containing protein [Chitinivibrionales bacterium]